MAFPFPMVITQETGSRRAIVLRGRSMPYRPVAWGERQRVKYSWFPGNPIAAAQVIGAEFKPTTMTGMWKDVFLFEKTHAPDLFNFPKLAAAAIPPPGVTAGVIPPTANIDSANAATLTSGPQGGQTFQAGGSIPANQPAKRARTIRDAMRLIGLEGQVIRVEWGSVVRFGFLEEWDFDHHREEDIEFELKFGWIGEKAAQDPLIVKPKIDVLGILAKIREALAKVLLAFLKLIKLINDQLTRITQFIRLLQNFIDDLGGLLEGLLSFALAPLDIVQGIRGILTQIRLTSLDLMRTVNSIQVQTGGLGPLALGMTSFTEILALLKETRETAANLALEAVNDLRELESLDFSDLLAVFTSPGGITLRDVAMRFYGNAQGWRIIAARNGLTGSIVPRGTVLQIPRFI